MAEIITIIAVFTWLIVDRYLDYKLAKMENDAFTAGDSDDADFWKRSNN
jgi:hypothetical protein